MPVKNSAEYNYDPATFELTTRTATMTDEVIAYYQTASYMYQHGVYAAITPEQQKAYAAAVQPKRMAVVAP
jgi:hypothetical protein